MKTCEKCKKDKENRRFIKDGNICDYCRMKERRDKNIKKKCSKCKKEKSIRQYNVNSNICKYCNSKCIHNKPRTRCGDCDGSGRCKEHDRVKTNCWECKPELRCKHGRIKAHCRDCFGSRFCIHEKQKSRCSICKGIGMCKKHNRRKESCTLCKTGKEICIHGNNKARCTICGTGRDLCNNCKYTRKNNRYGNGNYCTSCYFAKNPEDKDAKNNRQLKQDFINDIYKELYPKQKWDSFDKIIDNTCNRRRPDYFKDCITHILILEIDEDQHKGYNKQCERNRINELFTGFADRKIIMLRFNPDSYKNKNEDFVEGCFSYTQKIGKLKINKKKIKERLKTVQEKVEYYTNFDNIENKYQKVEVKQIKLFYDGYNK